MPDKSLSCSKAGRRHLGKTWQKLVGKKITVRICITEMMTVVLQKFAQCVQALRQYKIYLQ